MHGRPHSPARLPRALVLLLLAPMLMGKDLGTLPRGCGCSGRRVARAIHATPRPAWTVNASAALRTEFAAAAPERRYDVRVVVAQDPAVWTEPAARLTVSTRPPPVAGSAFFPGCCPGSGTRNCAYVDRQQRNAYLAVSIRDGSGAEIPSRPSCRGFAYPCGSEPLTTSCSAPGYDIQLSSTSPGAFSCDRTSRVCTAVIHLTLRATRPAGEGYEVVYRSLNPGLTTDPYPAAAPPPVDLAISADLDGPKVDSGARATPPAGLRFKLDVREAG
jgi:hypothetical protein